MNMNVLTVKELIEELEKIEDKNKPIMSYINFFRHEIGYVIEREEEVWLSNWEGDN